MIPKIIHYCWFGRKDKPKLVRKCINSWKRIVPDYELKEWNEDNFDFCKYPYADWCMKKHLYAFLSDFVRLLVIYQNGGIYLDTDVELIKRPDELLSYNAFFGFENASYIASGLGFGAIPGHSAVKRMIDEYLAFTPDADGNYPVIKCPIINTRAIESFGLCKNGKTQVLNDIIILSSEYLNPYDDPTGRLYITDNTVSIHWYGKSWMSKKTILRSRLTRPLHRIFGTDFFGRFRR